MRIQFQITKASNYATPEKLLVKGAYSKDGEIGKLAKAKTIVLPKVKTRFGTARWNVTSKDKKKTLSLAGNGKSVKVKKGAKKGTYKMQLKAKVKGSANFYGASSKAVTVKVTVK